MVSLHLASLRGRSREARASLENADFTACDRPLLWYAPLAAETRHRCEVRRAGRAAVGGLCTVILLSLAATAARAQGMMLLEGTTRSTDGAPLAGVQVTAVDVDTDVRRMTVTTESGRFRLLGLDPGHYTVTVRRVGYSPARQRVHLVVGQSARISFVIEPQPVTLDAVHVEAESPAAELRRSSVSFPVLEQEIRELPFNSRNVMELAAVAPGIRAFRALPRPQGRSVTALPSAGAFPEGGFTNLYVDGVSMKALYDGGIVGMPQTGSPFPADALREFRILLNPYDPEFSHAGVYLIDAVTHRGTNEMRGSTFGFFQNAGMVSTTAFQRDAPGFRRPDYSRQKAGMHLRGPILRSRLFYAATYELSNTRDYIHVAPGRPGDFADVWDEFAGAFPAPNRNHTGLLRMTYTPGERHALDAIMSLRYLSGITFFGETNAHTTAAAQDYAVHTSNLRHRWTPSSRFANEVSLQLVNWAHDERALTSAPARMYPSLVLGRPTSGDRIRERHVRVVSRGSYGLGEWHGTHLLRTGIELARVRSRGRLPLFDQGALEFATDTSSLPRRAMLGMGVNDPHTTRDGGGWVVGWTGAIHVGDEWQPTPRLTVNAGLRYDVELNTLNNSFAVPWASDPELIALPELERFLNTGDRKNDLDNVSPRAAFVWDASGDGRTFLRGGFGIMYDRVPRFAAFQERLRSTWRVYAFEHPGTTDVEALRQRVMAGDAGARPVLVLLPRRMETPFTRQWSIGAGRRVSSALNLNIDLVHQEVRDLFARLNLNWVDRSDGPPRPVLTRQYGPIVAWDSFARARYRALLAQLAYQGPGESRASLAYTLASARSDWDMWPDEVPVAFRDDFYRMQRTSGDERHRIVLSGIRPLPFGFSGSSIITVASPRPYKATDGRDLNGNGALFDDWLDGRRFVTPASRWRHWYRVIDVRLTRHLSLPGSSTLALSAEAFNLLNTQNYASYSGTRSDEHGQELASFGTPSAIFATRQYQIGARVDF
jgi:hypothetical protein